MTAPAAIQIPDEWLKPHPLFPLPITTAGRERLLSRLGTMAAFSQYLQRRTAAIESAKSDPLRYGFETTRVVDPDAGDTAEYLPQWEVLRALYAGTFTHNGVTYPPANDILLLGGKRASKTEPAAKFAVEALYTPQPGAPLSQPLSLARSGQPLVTNAGRTVWCWIMDETSSIDRQQTYVYKYLLPEHRTLGKQGHGNIKYARKTGFSERCLVLPAPHPEQCSVMRFFTYHQYRQDPDCAEGGETDFIWLDEPPPEELLETLRHRNATRNGKLLVSFNPKNGYTVSVGQYLEGAQVLVDRPARFVPRHEVWVQGCRPGHMPFVLKCHKPGRWVVVAYRELNPFNDMDRLAADAQGETMAGLKLHFYGWPERLIGVAFQRFTESVHVIPHSAVPEQGTDYVVIDPAGDRNWFVIWLRVDTLGRIFAWQEFPDASHGEWAVPSKKPDGARGPAQTADGGKGLAEYKRLILQLSGWERDAANGRWTVGKGRRIQEFIGDPRAFEAPVPGQEQETNLRHLMLDEQRDVQGVVTGPSIDIVAAPACGVEEGKTLINDALNFNPDQPLNVLNAPRLYVSDRCRNLIYCLKTWTGLDGEKGASKDPIDALKYALKRGIEYIDPKRSRTRGGGSY